MKYFLILLILSNIFCLKAKKSPFDFSKPSFGLFGFILFSINASKDTTPPTVTVTNLKSKGTIDTGLLVGTASDNAGVASVEVQINSSSYTAATTLTNSTTASGTKDWTYKLPITAKWSYAFTNTVNVRVTDTSGNATISALTSVQKGDNHDINGDGFVDLVVGAPTYGGTNGRVYVFNGSATGITQTSATSASQIFTGTAGRKFGSSIAMTDINGDGFADLVVCEFAGATSTSTSNAAYYFLGRANGFGSITTIHQRTHSAVANNEYCSSLATGDFNNDGFGDIAVADTVSGGTIEIYKGTSTGLNLTVDQTVTRAGPTNFGGSIAIGDINGDGKLDIVSRTLSAPNVYSFLGSTNTFTQSSSITLSNAISSLVLADFNGDGKADLAVGETGFSGTTGRAHIFLSNGTTLNTTASQLIVGEAATYLFSQNLSVGDANQDGITDLIAGSPGFGGPSDNGKVYIFYGCLSTGICKGSGNASIADIQITGTDTVQLGTATKMFDTNRDGFPDLLASGPIANSLGAVYIFKGSASGISSSYTSIANASLTIVGEQNASNFGLSLY